MKIGILTFHRAENFGAALQVFALSMYLKNKGFDVSVIDYKCPKIEHQYDIFNPHILFTRKNFIYTFDKYYHRLINSKKALKKKSIYREFRDKYLKLYPCKKEIVDDLGFDAYIVGSDQIWRLSLTGGVDKHYFLDFPMKDGAIKIAYAASSEVTCFSELRAEKKKLSCLLDKFDRLSVREVQLYEELKTYTKKDIKVCLDPTFLLPPSDYISLIKESKFKNYVLVYHLFETNEGSKLAHKIANEKNLQVVEIHSSVSHRKSDKQSIHIDVFGPQEMLGYIYNADTIITTSFHGLALSIIFNKQFWAINEGQVDRLRNLLGIVNLGNRLLDTSCDYNPNNRIDYSLVNQTINQARQSSMSFLQESLVK